ncbi:MAG: CRISPR-associated helicase Cas3' [Dehalococcoidia bacterium]
MTAPPSQTILAKSSSSGREITLADHIDDVLGATSLMFGRTGQPTRMAAKWLHFFRLQPEDFEPFFVNLWLAAAFHDLGKANDGFQALVRRSGEQIIRHEHLSALLLAGDTLREWLHSHQELGVDADIVTAAAASHHLKVTGETLARPLTDRTNPAVQVYATSPDVTAVLTMAGSVLDSPAPSLEAEDGAWGFAARVAPRKRLLREAMNRLKREISTGDPRHRLLLAVKAAVIAVDSAGSAAPRLGLDMRGWLTSAFSPSALTGSDIDSGIIVPRVDELQRRNVWQGFHGFQVAAATLPDRALLLSGCGSGKTLAAWKWASARLDAGDHSRVIFLYPTRGTATEGFRDYASWAGPELSALVHGTSQYDLADIFSNPDDARHGFDYTAESRLFALGYWHRRVFTATVDTFLAAMNHQYAAICMLPVLADSVVVIDEVHSFSESMFRSLERFLKYFDIPVLCMTASLPSDRQAVLADGCGLEIFPSDDASFADLAEQASAPRYRAKAIDVASSMTLARQALENGKKVLWVVNTVARCQAIAEEASAYSWATEKWLCYHSRFRLADRKIRHNEVIDRFRAAGGPMLLITTQVCEMSLDLDADVLITEAAPVPSLIQRMGRCCRQPLPPPGRLGEVYVYRPAAHQPYEPGEIDQGMEFAALIEGSPTVSQEDLGEYLADMRIDDSFIEDRFTGFLDSSWYAMSREDSFREEDEFTVDCVLDSEIPLYVEAGNRSSPETPGYILPAPRRLASPAPLLGRFLRSAPSSHYHPDFGLLGHEAAKT